MSLFFRKLGEGKPMVVLHGLFGSSDNWSTVAKRLSESYQVLLVDLRNHGRSPHSEAFDYKCMAEDVRQLIEAECSDLPVIMGHSMGGKVAIQLAVDYPHVLHRLISIDMGIKKYPPTHLPIMDALRSLDLKLESRKAIDLQLAKKIPSFSVRQFLLKNLKRSAEGGFLWKMNLDAIYRNYHHITQAIFIKELIEIPSLFVRGSNSNYILEKDIPLLEQKFSNPDILTIDHAGHWVHADQPEALIKGVMGWLSARA